MATAPSSSAAAAAAAAAAASVLGSSSATAPALVNEEELRKQLQLLTQNIKRREPLKTTYKHLLTDGVVTRSKPALPKSGFYRRIGSRLRETVERFMAETQGKDPFDRISQRQEPDPEKMRAALTLREFKEHEQQPLLEATLAAFPKRQGMDEVTRRRHLDGVVMGLQSPAAHKKPRKLSPVRPKVLTAAELSEKARQMAELDKVREEARQREEARRQREEESRRKRQEETAQQQQQQQQRTASRTATISANKPAETPQQALHKFYQPIFKMLWDMEFPYLGNTNPFRMIIDRDNCAAVGAPDYFDVVERPMNLTFIQRKVEAMEYGQLSEFFQDVELMLQNAITYNSDETNPYRIAAEEMLKRYKRAAKRTVQNIRKKHGGGGGGGGGGTET